MDQHGRLNGLAGLLSRQPGSGQSAQFVVKQRRQFVSHLGVVVNCCQNSCHFAHAIIVEIAALLIRRVGSKSMRTCERVASAVALGLIGRVVYWALIYWMSRPR